MHDELATDWSEGRCAAGGQTGAAGRSSVLHPHSFISVRTVQTVRKTGCNVETQKCAEDLQGV